MARLHADENFPLPVVTELRLLGHDVSTVEETGKANLGTPDLEVLEFAISQGRAVLTLSRRHFVRLHNRLPDHQGIIVCSTDNDFSGQAKRIHEALASVVRLDGQLIRVNLRKGDRGALAPVPAAVWGTATFANRVETLVGVSWPAASPLDRRFQRRGAGVPALALEPIERHEANHLTAK